MDGAELEFDEGALTAIAEKAIARKSGARGLRAILEDALLETMFELPSRQDAERVIVTEKTIRDGEAPVIVTGENKRKQLTAKTRREPGAAAEQPSVS